MPELPEVESIKLQLQKYLIGHKIVNVKINYAKIFVGNKKDIIGAKIKAIRRFAKVLSLDLDNGNSLVIQIKLTGQLIYRGPNLSQSPQLSEKITGGLGGKHTHVIFKLDRGGILYYNDVRKFGRIRLVETDKVVQKGLVGKLGPEPPVGKSDNRTLTLEKFGEILFKTKRAIKIVLMDQEKIGGVGNIYANDALWLAKVKPQRKASSLSKKEQKDLYDAIIQVLKKGIEQGGASEIAFVTPDGSEGGYQNHTLVYDKEGETCKRDKGKIKKIKLGGRGTYYCPVCQK